MEAGSFLNVTLEKFRFLFHSDDVFGDDWTPRENVWSDFRSAWHLAFTGSIDNFNETHSRATLDGHECVFQHTWQMVPEMAVLYPDEDSQVFDPGALSGLLREYYWVAILIVTAYLVLIFGGQMVMKSLPPFSLKYPLLLWNISLATFSFMGAIRTAPHLLILIQQRGLYASVCAPPCETYGLGATGYWSFLFIISKIPELVDTVFIVLRKKPLIFLHWYHHVTVLLYCWQSYATQSSAGLYFIAMNYSVHAVMYGYYALKTLKLWPRFIPSWIITIFQLSQMVVGIAVCVLVYKYQRIENQECHVTEVTASSGALMYFSYFLLFLQILIGLITGWLAGSGKKGKEKKA